MSVRHPGIHSGQDSSSRSLLMTGLGCLVFLILRHVFADDLLKAAFHFRLLELDLLACLKGEFALIKEQILNLPAVDEKRIEELGLLISDTLRVPVAVVLGLLAAWAFKASPVDGFHRVHTLHSLMKKRGRFWPACIPLLKMPASHKRKKSHFLVKVFNMKGSERFENKDTPPSSELTAGDLLKSAVQLMGHQCPFLRKRRIPFLSPWRDALTPVEWAQERGLVGKGSSPSLADIENALILDLGSVWRDGDALKEHEQALLVLFLGSGEWNSSVLQSYKLSLSRCWHPKKGFQASRSLKKMIRKSLENSSFRESLASLGQRHGYGGTILMAALVHGRAQKGILPPADFLWLKAVDRPLWYGLHNLGRRTFHVEALALMSHYRTEIKSGKRSAFPLIGRAADALFKKLNSSPLPTGETLP